jgi:hypothetical protein
MTISPPKTPTWLLERLAQGELDAAETERLRVRLAAEGRSLDTELAALTQSNRALLAAQPKAAMAAAIRQRAARAATISAARRTPRRWNLWIPSLALVGSLGVALLLVRGGQHPPLTSGGPATVQSSDDDEPTQIKGDAPRAAPRLLVYRQRGAGGDTRPERLSNGARAAHGDLLQLAYAAARDGLYGVLISIDGAGRVTQHLPEEGAVSSAPLRSTREIRLPSAYELDDAPGFERFVFITAAQPFPVAVALDAARALAVDGAHAPTLPLGLAPSFHQTSVLLHKTSKGTP